MTKKESQIITEMAQSVFMLRRKCALKDGRIIAGLNVTQSEYNCLTQFLDADTLGVKDLAKRLEITPGGVTHILTTLESKGLIERRISPEDRRNIDVNLTSEGKKDLEHIRSVSMKLHAEIMNFIEPESRPVVLSAIRNLCDAIDSWLAEPENSRH